MTGSPGWVGERVTNSYGLSCWDYREGPSLCCLEVLGRSWRRKPSCDELSQPEPEEPLSDGRDGRESLDALWW